MADFVPYTMPGGFTPQQSNGPTTSSTQNSWLEPQWSQWINNMGVMTGSNPIQPYGGPTVAPWNPMQQTAADMAYNQATGGSPALNAANGAIANTAQGGIVNPYAVTPNPYMGVNPYTQQVIDSTNSNMADAYAKGTAAQTAGAFNQAGAYGGSAYQDTQAQNNKAFAQALGQTDSGLLNQNYYANAGMAQNTLNNAANAFQQGQQNQLGAASLGLQSQYGDINAINNLYNMGANQQGYTQNVLNGMQNYYGQAQMAPWTTQQLYGNALSQANGASLAGSTSQPGMSPYAWIGAAPALLSLFGLAGSGPTG